jgi:hypothetical protein
MSFHLGLVLTVGALAVSGRAPDLEVATLDSLQRPGGGVGVAVIRCATRDASLLYYSRGAILDVDLGSADHDVILATAHGLPANLESVTEECKVLGPDNRYYRVEGVWSGRTTEAGREDAGQNDWAVLLTKHRLEGDVARLRAGQVTNDAMAWLNAEHTPLRMLLRNPDLPTRDCVLRESTTTRETAGLISYSCHSSPGSSGSPILTAVAGRAWLIGIHLGWGFTLENDGVVRAVSIGRAIDAEIAAAITAAAAQASGASRAPRR